MPRPQVPRNPPEDPRDHPDYKGGKAELGQHIFGENPSWGKPEDTPEPGGCGKSAAVAVGLFGLGAAAAFIGHKYGGTI